MVDTPIARRFDELCKFFYEVAENGVESNALFDLVMNGIRELQIRTIDAKHHIHQIQKSNTLKHPDEHMSNQSKVVLSPIQAPGIGRPPSKRRESKVDQVVRKMRGKKQIDK